jgi:ABC-type tungstate transport system permease subunit
MHKQHHPQIQGYVIDDPALRRPYLAAVAASAHTDAKQHARAEMLHRFLRSNEAQSILAAFRLPGHPRIPIFYPLTSDIHPDKGVTYVP